MTDPVQLLIDAGAIPATPFEPQSRYYGVALGVSPRKLGVHENVSDGVALSAVATVTFDIVPVNDAPVAEPHAVAVPEDESVR